MDPRFNGLPPLIQIFFSFSSLVFFLPVGFFLFAFFFLINCFFFKFISFILNLLSILLSHFYDTNPRFDRLT